MTNGCGPSKDCIMDSVILILWHFDEDDLIWNFFENSVLNLLDQLYMGQQQRQYKFSSRKNILHDAP